MRVFYVIFGNYDAAEGGEIGASAEFFADVFGESADVGAGADVGADFECWVIVF